MRAEWYERQSSKFSEKNGWEGDVDEDLGADVHNYFKRTTSGNPLGAEPMMVPQKQSIADSDDTISNGSESKAIKEKEAQRLS
jgi:hypothetical protein